ncbi:hypothetical protein P4S72_16805 [Vibrio sp. PP-XX7]
MCYYAIHKDITETHQLQVHQKTNIAMFQTVFNAAPIAIALIDDHQQMLLSNDRFNQVADSIGISPVAVLIEHLQQDYQCESISDYMSSHTPKIY